MTSNDNEPESVLEIHESFERILVADVLAAQERLNDLPTQSAMRDLIRSGFAAIDGMVWLVSNHTLSISEEIESLTPTEVMALSQTGYRVTDAGVVKEVTQFIPVLTAIRLIDRITQRFYPGFDAGFDQSGWADLREAVRIRNRVTHPKQRSDLILTQADIATCISAIHWFFELAVRLMEAMNSAFATHTAELRDVFEALKSGDAEAWKLYREMLESNDD
jgi:hypothetical protein